MSPSPVLLLLFSFVSHLSLASVSKHQSVSAGIAVALGASAGAVSRYAVTELVAADVVSITAINLLGCLLLGVISAVYASRPLLNAFLGTGFCGGFTTFSAFILLILSQARVSIVAGALILVIHLLLCPVAYAIGQRFTTKPRGTEGRNRREADAEVTEP